MNCGEIIAKAIIKFVFKKIAPAIFIVNFYLLAYSLNWEK